MMSVQDKLHHPNHNSSVPKISIGNCILHDYSKNVGEGQNIDKKFRWNYFSTELFQVRFHCMMPRCANQSLIERLPVRHRNYKNILKAYAIYDTDGLEGIFENLADEDMGDWFNDPRFRGHPSMTITFSMELKRFSQVVGSRVGLAVFRCHRFAGLGTLWKCLR
jgi:hypothetical protein